MFNWNPENMPMDEDMMDYSDIDENGEFEVLPQAHYYTMPFYYDMYYYNPYSQFHNPHYRSQNQMFPPGPPPNYVPQKSMAKSSTQGISTKAIDPGQINFCLFKFTYIWQTNGRSYWAYLLKAGRNSISGFRWRNRRWVYFGLDLRNIDSFFC